MKNLYIILILIITLLGCNKAVEKETPSENATAVNNEVVLNTEQIANAGIVLGKLEKHLLSNDVNARGKIALPPQNKALVSTMIGGVVRKISVIEGSFIKKGQTLAQIIHPEIIQLQEDYLSTMAQYEFEKADYKRQEELENERITSAKESQKAKAEYLETHAKLSSLKLKLRLVNINPENVTAENITDHINITSPVSGYINKIETHIGKYESTNSVLFEVVDLSKLYVELMVFEKDILKVKKGQRINFRLSNLENVSYEARIIAIANTVNEDTKTVKIIAEFFNNSAYVLPGMFVTSTIHTNEEELDAIPEDAILLDENNEHFIFYTMPSWKTDQSVSFRKMNVQVGFEEDGYVHIINSKDIPEKAHLVIKGGYYLKSTMLSGEE